MSMKIYNLIVGCAVLVALSSCNNWLDITPEDMVTEDELYKDGQGFRNALNGVYKQMTTSDMYGCNMTWGMNDVAGNMYQSYSLPPGTAYYRIANEYDYAHRDVKSLIQSTWSKTYNSIANCNNLLSQVEAAAPEKFVGGELEQQMIQGEALALRAILHFDMLRFFAPAPIKVKADAQLQSRTFIPYYEVYPSRFEPRLTVEDVLGRVRRDLVKAKDLVAAFDTLQEHKVWMKVLYRFEGNRQSSSSQMPTDMFYSYRGYRMNYYAICAMLARVYNYSEMHEEANALAQEVIDVEYDTEKYFTFTTEANINNGNRKLYDDLIFSLSNSKVNDIYETANANSMGEPILYLNNGSYMFDDPADYRQKLVEGGYRAYCNKYTRTNSGTLAKYAADMIPMIRLGEMYYIQAEYHMSKGDVNMAVSKLDQVRGGRNCTMGNLRVSNESTFRTALIAEANREFMQEGQLFFYYKKFGIYPSYSMRSDDKFYFPLPDNEQIN